MAIGPDRFRHFAAIDWSGALGATQPGIAVAVADRGDAAPRLIDRRWSRQGIFAWLLEELPADTLVGFDLGPALPFVDARAYFPGWGRSPSSAHALWALVDELCAGEPNLGASGFVDHPEAARYFRRHGGRLGDRFGIGAGRFRVTERAQRAAGLNPYSGLNLVGAAQVGKSSLTGMRMFHRLGGRLPLWPFDPVPPNGSVLVEIYTTIAAIAAGRSKGRSKMRHPASLNAALAELGSAPFEQPVRLDDHRCDALVTAAWLRKVAARADLWAPAGLTRDIARTEGWTFGVA